MNKSDFIRATAKRSGRTQGDTNATLTAAIDVATEALARGEPIMFQSFGKLETRQRAAKAVYNFAAGDIIERPACKTVVFVPADELKRSINQQADQAQEQNSSKTRLGKG